MARSERTSQIATPDHAAAEHDRQRRSGAASASGTDADAATQVRHLLDRAGELNLRAPELARVLGERAALLAESAGANTLWIHAEALAVLTAVRLGYRAETVGRAVTVLRAAEDSGEHVLAVRLRTALAVCARSVGTPLTGLAVLRRAVSGTGVPGSHRATALCQLARCVSGVTGKSELDKTFATADRLCTEDGTLTADTRLVRRALLRVGMSVHRRRYGDVVGAADAARTGIGFLDGLDEPANDGGVARARLALELASSSLDRGEGGVALEVAGPILARPLRAAEVGPVAWLRLAIATRVHLAAGEGYAATRLLRDALRDTDRYEMRGLSAQLRSELAHVEERMGRPGDALETLRDARADERAQARSREHAHAILTSEFDGAKQPELNLDEILADQPVGASAAHVAEAGAVATHAAVEPVSLRSSATAQQQQDPTVDHETQHRARRSATGSVLDRLGITGGNAERAGGRRRAADTSDDEAAADTATGKQPSPSTTPEDTATDVAAGSSSPQQHTTTGTDTAGGAAAAESAAAVGSAATDDSVGEQLDWLPKLRLPPSLAPVEELYATDGRQHQSDDASHETPTVEQDAHRTVESAATRSDQLSAEPAADAGLAELLTRALAEHQSGSSSAATLVARLESSANHSEEGAHRNGRHRTDP